MSALLPSYESKLLSKLKNDDQAAFSIIFTKYYSDLIHFSFSFTRNSEISEEIVQEIFLNLWQNRKSREIHTSLRSFLLKTVQNRSIDSLRHENISHKYASAVLDHPTLSENNTENYILFSELKENLEHALGKIPVHYAEVFRKSRIETKNYQEIAAELGISVRTVEVRIGKALSLLRKALRDFLILVFILFQLFH